MSPVLRFWTSWNLQVWASLPPPKVHSRTVRALPQPLLLGTSSPQPPSPQSLAILVSAHFLWLFATQTLAEAVDLWTLMWNFAEIFFFSRILRSFWIKSVRFVLYKQIPAFSFVTSSSRSYLGEMCKNMVKACKYKEAQNFLNCIRKRWWQKVDYGKHFKSHRLLCFLILTIACIHYDLVQPYHLWFVN